MKKVKIAHLVSETRNPRTMNMDQMSIRELLTVMNEEDSTVVAAVAGELPSVEHVIRLAIETLQRGGRVVYAGAGTAGRIGELDAVECTPTFGCTDEFSAILAGGRENADEAKEDREDSEEEAVQDLKQFGLRPDDMVIGIAASGRTPYTLTAVRYAGELGCHTAAISNNKNSELGQLAEVAVEVVTGPEILTGSTRLRAATAQKMVCNMISTVTMKEMGKTYQNLMVDMQPTNSKLVERAKKIVMEATGCTYETAENTLQISRYNMKTAIVMVLCQCDAAAAESLLSQTKGFVAQAYELGKQEDFNHENFSDPSRNR